MVAFPATTRPEAKAKTKSFKEPPVKVTKEDLDEEESEYKFRPLILEMLGVVIIIIYFFLKQKKTHAKKIMTSKNRSRCEMFFHFLAK